MWVKLNQAFDLGILSKYQIIAYSFLLCFSTLALLNIGMILLNFQEVIKAFSNQFIHQISNTSNLISVIILKQCY